jgi:hypothetical protein
MTTCATNSTPTARSVTATPYNASGELGSFVPPFLVLP